MKTIDDIIPELIELTQRNRLHWFASDSRYRAKISPSFDVAVWSWVDTDTDEEGITAILERDGMQIDSTRADRFAAHYLVLSRLYDTARRQANNVGESIDHVLHLLAALKA